MASEVALGRVGIILGLEVSRLARKNPDWYRLLDLWMITDTLIGDSDGLYYPALFNERLVLGLKGTISEATAHHSRAIRRRHTEQSPARRVAAWIARRPGLGVMRMVKCVFIPMRPSPARSARYWIVSQNWDRCGKFAASAVAASIVIPRTASKRFTAWSGC
jgi:hypothetical protein